MSDNLKINSRWISVPQGEIELRMTISPEGLYLQEAFRSKIAGTLQDWASSISAFWGVKPEFTGNVLADDFIPKELSPEQEAKVISLFNQEKINIENQQKSNIDSYKDSFTEFCNSIRYIMNLSETLNTYEETVTTTINQIKQNIPDIIKPGDQRWEASKEAILSLADTYFKYDERSFVYERSGLIRSKIKEILEKQKFIRDPARYLAKWHEKRGAAEEFRIPEDPARYFLSRFF